MKKILFVILFLLITNSLLFSQTILNEMVARGFENVVIENYDDDLILSYENRIYRDEVTALYEIMKLVSGEISKEEYKLIHFLPQNREILLADISISHDALLRLTKSKSISLSLVDLIHVSYDIGKYVSIIEKGKNKRSYKLDIVFTPKFRAELDEFGDPVKLQIGIAPGIETSFGQGSLFRGEFIVPIIHRKFRVGDPEDPFRPGLVNLNQTLRFPGSFFLSTSLGLFSNHRLGIDLEMRKYFLEGRFSLGGRLGYTGSGRIYEGKWETSMIDELIYFADAEWHMPWYNLSLAVNYGQYIYEDKGFRIDLKRSFNEVDIGFFVTRTESDLLGNLTSGGFNFSIPIFPDEYAVPKFVRFRPAHDFTWEYNYQHFVYFNQKSYDTGNNIKSFIKNLQPYYIKMRLKQLITNN